MSAHRNRRSAGAARRATTETAAGVRELARLLRKSPSTVSGWLRRPDWPFGPPPWQIERVREWAAVSLSTDPAAAMRERLGLAAGGAFGAPLTPARARAELAQILARTRLLLQRHDRHAAKLHDSEICQARHTRQAQAVSEHFLSLARTLAPRLVGQVGDEIERQITAAVAIACNTLAEGGT